MAKKGKKDVLVVGPPPPSSSAYPMAREDDRARFKYQSLMQDFEDLIKENDAKKQRLLEMKRRKLRLLAEVKFLRRKYRCFTEKSSQETQYRLKKHLHRMPSPSYPTTQSSNPFAQSEHLLNGRNDKVKESGRSSTTPILDLNQCSFPNGEDSTEFQVDWEEPLNKVEMLKRGSNNGEYMINDLNIPICRDNGSSSVRLKRKISWQDQMAVKV